VRPPVGSADLGFVALVEMSARIGAMIVHAAAAAGAPVDELCRATGFDPSRAADPDARISLSLEESLWSEAARLSGDDALGLHAAEGLRPGVFDVLDYAVRTAPTPRVALDRLARYNRLEHSAAVFTVTDAGDVTRVEHAFGPGGGVQSRHSAEFTLASLVVIGSQIAEDELAPLAVEFHHGPPPSTAEHERLFRVVPGFSRPTNAVEFDRAILERLAPAADPLLWRVIERHAEALLAERPAPVEGAGQRVRRLLTKALADGDASLGAMAARLRMSDRTLQRRLASEGVSFDGLLDETRRELAVRYLHDRQMAIAEVAYLLGYSEPSAFHRAFKRWTGWTPAETRRGAA
jgi:AraC-like DNA-binding protein